MNKTHLIHCTASGTEAYDHTYSLGYQVNHDSEIRLSIKGGLAPYTIRCTRTAYNYEAEVSQIISENMKTTGGDYRYSWEVSITGISKHRSKSFGIFGTDMQYHHYTYHFTIVDSLDNVAEVDVEMQSNNPESNYHF